MNVTEYERLVAIGEKSDSTTELLDGVLVRKPAKSPLHVCSVDATKIAIGRLVPEDWLVRQEGPVRISECDEPEPDVALVRGTRLDYKTRHPVRLMSAYSWKLLTRALIETAARNYVLMREREFRFTGS